MRDTSQDMADSVLSAWREGRAALARGDRAAALAHGREVVTLCRRINRAA